MSSVLKTLVGDDVDLLDFEDLAGRLGSRLQQPHVDDLVGHLQAECSHVCMTAASAASGRNLRGL